MRARPADPVAAVMTSPVSRLSAQAGRAAILGHPGWRQLRALPVVGEASLLIGAISYETFRALEDEARGRDRRLDAVSTVFALGELYWLSLSGMMDGVATVVRRASRANQSGRVLMALSESSRAARTLVGEFARRYPGEAARGCRTMRPGGRS